VTITVYVKVWGMLRQHHPGSNRSEPIELALPDGATVADLRLALNMPMELVNRAIAFLAEGRASPEHVLQDGDLLHLAPPVSGGGIDDSETGVDKTIEGRS